MYDDQALASYQSTSIESGSPAQVVVQLYRGAIRFAEEAARAARAGDHPTRAHQLGRATRVVQELNNALDHDIGGEWSQRLSALYEYVEYEWVESTLQRNPGRIDDGVRILRTLLASWEKIASGEVPVDAPDRAGVDRAAPEAGARANLSLSC